MPKNWDTTGHGTLNEERIRGIRRAPLRNVVQRCWGYSFQAACLVIIIIYDILWLSLFMILMIIIHDYHDDIIILLIITIIF